MTFQPITSLATTDVRTIRDAVGGTKAMAERLGVTERQVRYLMARGAKRKKTVAEIRRLAKPKG